MIRSNIKLVIALFILVIVGEQAWSQSHHLRKIQKLSGDWKFSIGDDEAWSSPDFNDSNWENIYVPGMWERQGFYGYDGYAWYRNTIELNFSDTKKPLYLSLGYIDDVDEVYLNGKLIGRTGSFPSYYASAFNAKRLYLIPLDLLNKDGQNTIAIRVYDEGGEGGIIHGTIGIMEDMAAIPVDLDLQGRWNFKLGDVDIDKKGTTTDFSKWSKILVPGMWENQGYKNYDGLACYGIEFELNSQFVDQRMVLVLGKVDDFDRVYLNGVLVGSSGEFKLSARREYPDMYKQLRGYYLPLDVLNDNGKNTLIVKVLDSEGIGGIYEGSVGLITQENYIDYWRDRRYNQVF